MNVLLVEDDAEIAKSISRGLTAESCTVTVARTGPDGLKFASRSSFDVIVMDRMLPGVDGIKIVKQLRADGVQTPVLYLTAVSGIHDRVEGFEAGGDDYLVKPFAFVELLARLRALARRGAVAPVDLATQLQAGDLIMDLIKRTVMRNGRLIDLLPQEFKLLEYFMRHQGKAVTRKMLLENVWDIHFDPRTSVVESHISRLRSKISPRNSKELIKTIRNTGYMLRVEP